MRRSFILVAFFLLTAAGGFAGTWSGRPLVDALRELEGRGLHLIYSSEVVRMEMTVRGEPHATEPRAILEELLRAQHLHVIDGPKGTLLIVRDAEADVPAATPAEPPAAVLPVTVDEIVVMPSHFGILGAQPEQRQFLSREEVRALPHFSDDIYRAINRIPGAASSDVSASFNLRGGDRNEVEVLLDGLPIYEPFHLKDLFSVFSTVDSEAIGSVDILTGGFPAEYGGRMSGVIDIASLTPTGRQTEVGISVLNSRLLTGGTFNADRGQWLFSFRPGYLHPVLQLFDKTDGLDPSYYDMLGKVQWQVRDSTIVSANLFSTHDNLRLDESDGNAKSTASDRYLWLNARSSVTPRIFSQNVLGFGRATRARDGHFDDGDENGALRDHRSFEFALLKNDTTFTISPRQLIKAGLTARQVNAKFDFEAHALDLNGVIHFPDPTIINRRVDVRRSGNDLSAYASDRMMLRPNLIAEVGVRADRQSYTPDGAHLSPRLNLGWGITPSTSLRAAWGRYVQPQNVEELQVEDGVTAYSKAQSATHIVLGIDHVFARGWSARVEAYEKRLSDPRPRFENLFDGLELFPEIRADRVQIAPTSGRARGTEFLVRKDGGAFSGWISYSRASVRDKIDGVMVPRAWDQRNAVNFSLNYGHTHPWNVNLSGVFHSGWPTTGLDGYLTQLPDGSYQLHLALRGLNAERLPSYARLDVRGSRTWHLGGGSLSFFVEAMNLLNHANVSRVEGFRGFINTADQTVRLERVTESIIPLIPSFGVTWHF